MPILQPKNILLPLSLALILGAGTPSHAGDKGKKRTIDGTTMIFNGNKFEIKELPPADTVFIVDPVTGDEQMKVSVMDPTPIKLNGDDIATYEQVNRMPTYKESTVSDFKNDVAKEVTELFSKFKDGVYALNLGTLILDKNGAIVYYDPYISVPPEHQGDPMVKEQVKMVVERVERVLEKMPEFKPAAKDGKRVPFYLTSSFSGPYQFTVKNRKVTYDQ